MCATLHVHFYRFIEASEGHEDTCNRFLGSKTHTLDTQHAHIQKNINFDNLRMRATLHVYYYRFIESSKGHENTCNRFLGSKNHTLDTEHAYILKI